jgi:pyrroline-5-carboxylate reductase
VRLSSDEVASPARLRADEEDVVRRLVVVGGGRMGTALLGGMLRSGWADPGALGVVEKRPEAREELVARFPGVEVTDSVPSGEAAVLAVKPVDVEVACRAVARAGYRRVLSIVAGVPLERLESHLEPHTAVVRAMSNTPALVGLGASAISAGRHAGEEDLAWAEGILSSTGVVARLPERLLDAVTGLSGSGPAYVFLVAEALVDAGVMAGLDREVSRMLVVQTILGSARMLAETGESATTLRHAVTSPGGTTAAALRVLEGRGIRSALLEAVVAAVERSRALGGAESATETLG